MVNISTRREFVWDDFIIDIKKTTAERRVHNPVRREDVIVFDKPWEGDGCCYFNTVYDEEKHSYRMYYAAWEMLSVDGKTHTTQYVKFCVIESKDGIHWERPNLGLVEFDGSKDNNIVIAPSLFENLVNVDNFYVTLDTNPNPAVSGKYKAVMAFPERQQDGSIDLQLASLTSDDGYTFRKAGIITRKGYFDTLNTVMWHEATGQYICYCRSFHEPGTFAEPSKDEKDRNRLVRDIRVMFSKDFISWSEPEPLDFGTAEDFPLYTNAVTPYPGAEHMLVGFPTRYVERPEWTGNFDRLCGSEKRAERCKVHPRYGLATTDCLFMCSRDGKHFTRYDEAFIKPGPEFPANWVYGSCYPNVGLITSKGFVEGSDDELSMYGNDNHWMSKPAILFRMAIRKDGFVSLHAGIKPEKIITKSFTFDGDMLLINFSTSARGYMYVRIISDDGSAMLSSCELFGDRANRIVDFDGSVAALAGKSVHIEIDMCDADFYAFQFQCCCSNRSVR